MKKKKQKNFIRRFARAGGGRRLEWKCQQSGPPDEVLAIMLRFGLFENFKWRTSLLLWGDAEGMRNLTALLREMAEGRAPVVRLQDLPWARSVLNTTAQMSVAPPAREGSVLARIGEGWAAEWRATAEQFAWAADLVAELVPDACVAGHQYLDLDKFQIMISKGEYPDDFARPRP